MKPLRTQYIKAMIPEAQATTLFEVLRDTIEWEEGIRSKKGFTRLAKSTNLVEYPEIRELILTSLKKFKLSCNYTIYGVYINYYRDGTMWTPNHTHKGTHQLVLSFGTTRTLNIGKKTFEMENGDAVLFGSSIHGVPKEENVMEGRISIATFMRPEN